MLNRILLFALINVLYDTASLPMDGWPKVLLMTLECIPGVILVPRFVLNLRRLYERDLEGRFGSNVDAAFGLTSGSIHGIVASIITFADAEKNDGLAQGEEIPARDGETRADRGS